MQNRLEEKCQRRIKKVVWQSPPIFIFMVELSGGMGAVEVGDNMPAESLWMTKKESGFLLKTKPYDIFCM